MNKNTTKGNSVRASAPPQIAEDGIRPRSDQTRLRLVVPIGVIIAVAIICIIVAVLSAARRADEVSLNREQQLIRQAVSDRAARVLQEVDSVAETQDATEAIRREYDPQWVERRAGYWLETFFDDDMVVVVDASDRVEYERARAAAGPATIDWPVELAAILDLLRGHLGAPAGTVPIVGAPDALQTRRFAAIIERFGGRPAIIAAVAVGSDSDLASGNAGAPIIIAVKYIDAAMLREIGNRLQLPELHQTDDPAPGGKSQVVPFADTQGHVVARLAWTPTRPGGQILWRVLPFIAVALAGLVLLLGVIIYHMRRTARKITAGEAQLRHLALHDPVCGLPNRIYFGERLENMIDEVRRGGPSAAVFYVDLDHFKDVNDTLGHHVGDELILHVTKRLSQVMREEDLVARLGGDEFAIVTTCGSDSYSLQAIAGRILAAVCAPYAISGHNIVIGASIGIAVIDRRAKDSGDILRYADMALYRAKNEGRNRACIYDAAMDADLSQRKLLEGDLLYAIRNDGLNAAYQPIVNVQRRQDDRRRSAGALDASDRGRHPALRVYSDRREFGPDHRARRVDAAPRLPRRQGVAGIDRRGQRLAAPVPPSGLCRSGRAHPQGNQFRSNPPRT